MGKSINRLTLLITGVVYLRYLKNKVATNNSQGNLVHHSDHFKRKQRDMNLMKLLILIRTDFPLSVAKEKIFMGFERLLFVAIIFKISPYI